MLTLAQEWIKCKKTEMSKILGHMINYLFSFEKIGKVVPTLDRVGQVTNLSFPLVN